ncbi:RNA-binding protein [Candidatus Pacearchaeota archaeon]|nr:RNA-binding protein [Candidatus Pacearchaeota archaeon]
MKIYVGNLPFSIDDEALKKLFSAHGAVEEASIIKDKFSGRSKGFGFVTMGNDAEAKKAIAALSEKDFEGRNLKVSEAKPMDPDRPPRKSFGNDRGPPRRSFGNDRGPPRRY